jgi:outer membrane protein
LSPLALHLLLLTAEAAPLTYTEALERALAHNAGLAGANLDVAAADGALLAAKGIFDPMASASLSRSSSVEEGLTFGFATTTDNRSSAWNIGISKYFQTGTTTQLNWANSKNQTVYSAADAARLEQVRQLGFLNEDEIFSSRLAATVTQPLLQGFRMATNLSSVRLARRARDQAEAQRLALRQQVLADTARSYWALYSQARLVDIARQTLEVAQEEQRIVEVQVSQGTLAPVERARVALAVVQAESALIDAEVAQRNASQALLFLLGAPPKEEIETATAPAEPTDLAISIDSAVESALKNNPTLQNLRITVTNAEASLADARHRRLPQLDATGSYGLAGFEVGTDQNPSSSMQTAGGVFDGDLRNWSVGANLSVPLGNRADKGSADQAGAQLQRARVDLEASERSIEQQVRTQVENLRTNRSRVALAEANVRLAEQTLSAERALQATGRTVQKNVLEAMKNLSDAQVGLERARGEFLSAIIELERLKGSL